MITAHDDPKSVIASMHNAALGVFERAGHTVVNSELYAEQFNPVATMVDFATNSGVHADYIFEQQRAVNTGSGFSPDIQAEMDKVKAADMIIFHFPLWWGGSPAIMKGWTERILAMGFAWNSDARYNSGLMRGKTALVSITAPDPENYYSAKGEHKATVEQHMYGMLHGTLAFCGFDVLKPYTIYGTAGSSVKELEPEIDKYNDHLQRINDNSEFIYKHS